MTTLVSNYVSSSEDELQENSHINDTIARHANKRQKVNLNPEIQTTVNDLIDLVPTSKEITTNLNYNQLNKQVQGPINPFSTNRSSTKNTLTGFVEEAAISDFQFQSLQRTFKRDGYTLNPDGMGYVGDINKAILNEGSTIAEEKQNKTKKQKRLPKGDSSKVDGYFGPWAGYENENVGKQVVEGEINKSEEAVKVADDVKLPVVENIGEEEKEPEVIDPEDEELKKNTFEKTIFHGKSELDYLGRSYLHVPTDLDIDLKSTPGDKECFLPKKVIHTWTGHTKGVNAINFFPNSGHLLLSGSMDNSVKLWDAHHDRKLLRTFLGHTKAVKDINFNFNGTSFVSAGYDKWIKNWDTETGQCINRMRTKRLPYCVKFNPDFQRANTFLVGCADKCVYQFDIRSNKVVQTYNQHMGAINTITFVDNNRRFVTTSDDKTIRAWEFGIPVVIKYIAEADMHSMPAVSRSYNKKWLACQSLDNQILIYSATDKFKYNRNKVFKGHLIAGYACKPSFSPDDRFLCSGDSEGKVWFWDFKTCKVLKKLKGHEGVVIGSEWNPQEQSKVATCGWDGTIK
ncbi:pre-mRNA-processing factor 17 [Clydaea vesicula]|uniref:Pre-mRNA-processing factor 17 n=1 Tax=Clydaea vesicula TaxID=447962 RepID=A0AAD5TXY8_9FUNG|nr:pre-mRNA-processing factor 17 [Clydaea vesicula]